MYRQAQPDGGEGKNCSVFLRLLEVEDSTTPERVVHFTCNVCLRDVQGGRMSLLTVLL